MNEVKDGFVKELNELLERWGLNAFLEVENGRAYLDVWPTRSNENTEAYFEVENSDL